MIRIVPALLVFVFCVHAQTAAELHSRISESVASRNYQSAIADLELIATNYPEAFKANNFDYLLARLSERTGDLTGASKYYNAVRSRDSILREYATWHLSQIARISGNLIFERVLLMDLAVAAPDSLLIGAVRQRIARSQFEGKNYDLAIDSLSKFSGASAEPGIDRENKLLLGRSYLYSAQNDSAKAIFNELIATVANPPQPDDIALEAVKGVDLIETGSEKFGKEVSPLSDYEHLKRAQIYQFNRDFANARLHFAAIVNNHPTSGIAPDAIYQIGRGYSQTANFTEAVKWYERVGEQHADHSVNKDALLQLASAYSRLGKNREAIFRYERYIEKFPDDERVDRAYLNIIDVLRDSGEETEAFQRAAKVQEVFRGKTGEAQGLFVQARIRIARNDWNNALSDLDKLRTLKELGGTTVPGGTTPTEVAFVRAFVLEQLRRYAEAIDAYLAIPDGPNEYYGWLATERLKAMSVSDATRAVIEERSNVQFADAEPSDVEGQKRRMHAALRLTTDESIRAKALEPLRKAYASLPAYKTVTLPKLVDTGRKALRTTNAVTKDHRTTADDLIFLGLYDEAAPEFEFAVRGKTAKSLSPDLEYTIAHLYLKGDRADRAAAFIEPPFKIPADYHPDLLPKAISEMLYPAPYIDSLLKHSPSRNVDPRFLLAIMRQESRFRPNVKSVAAARGLMQFISTTSERIAGELGRNNFDQNELYYPPTAILFGSQYVGSIFKLFPDKPEAVAASYNGGEDNMKRWHGRAKSDLPERYVPEIAFSQSKDYVWRVMANYRMYQMLYDDKLNRK